MALGGGAFTARNKTLPGAYVNFISLARVGATFSERGTAAFALDLDWGLEDRVFTVTAAEFAKNSLSIFGYDYGHEKLKGLRDLFANAATVHAYRLGNPASHRHADCEYGAARFSGRRGNDLTLIITEGDNQYTVRTLLDGVLVDSQTVTNAEQLVDNDFVIWDDEAILTATAGIPFTGGENGEIGISDYQRFLAQIESYSDVNAIGVCSDNPQINSLFAGFAKRLRDQVGIKLQCVVFNHAADHEG